MAQNAVLIDDYSGNIKNLKAGQIGIQYNEYKTKAWATVTNPYQILDLLGA
jgi:hypothetical protein